MKIDAQTQCLLQIQILYQLLLDEREDGQEEEKN